MLIFNHLIKPLYLTNKKKMRNIARLNDREKIRNSREMSRNNLSKGAIVILCFSILLSGCATMNKTGKGALIGAGGGAAVGAGIGALIGKDGKSSAFGAAIGTVVGSSAGAIIGKKMDKKAAELQALENAKIETVTDANNLQAIRVTFDSGILFATNSSTLSSESKTALKDFATKMKDLPDTDFTIQGHTDNTGTREVNEKISLERAQAVSKYLQSCSIQASRLSEVGLAFDVPVADNSTADGRRQNRRVEIYITANEKMIDSAEKEASK